jgi:biotin carboxyl carrier protein
MYYAPNVGLIVAVLVRPNQQADINQPSAIIEAIIEAMKVQTTVCA